MLVHVYHAYMYSSKEYYRCISWLYVLGTWYRSKKNYLFNTTGETHGNIAKITAVTSAWYKFAQGALVQQIAGNRYKISGKLNKMVFYTDGFVLDDLNWHNHILTGI